ncbi:MAG TPA: SDR family NAD(P)-dependent oxidoreductase [Xanthobacteraceae bacterium]|nr:SDR family NAD(P)-dependent oxidoreductase [Xanthobacteraceae bacterium]
MTAATIITGGSGGIGAALAHEAAGAGRKLVLVSRSAEGLAKVADAIAAKGQARPEIIALDLAEAGAADRLAGELSKRGLSVFELVNNAGYGLVGPVVAHSRADELGIVDLNVRALTDLTLKFLPEIIAARGGILNVASTAAFQPGPYAAIYYASKAYVLSFSEALAYELRRRVRVTALCPGPVPTNFQRRANPGKDTLFSHLPGMSAEKCAAVGWRGFEAGKRVVIPGFLNKVGAFLSPRAPRKPVIAASAYLASKRRAK